MTMGVKTAEHDYVHGQLHTSHAALFQRFEQANANALATSGLQTDLAYGPHPRQRYDLCTGPGQGQGVVLYFHAGYWQARDKSQFRFLAPAMRERGLTLALMNYPLCPDTPLPGITRMVRDAIPAVRAQLSHLPADTPWIACGHSAGAHLAVELALSQCYAPDGLACLSGVVAISGIYDLLPLLDTTLNRKLLLDTATAAACSPLRRVHAGAPPAHFVVGGLETSAFLAQSRNMAEAWRWAGNTSHHDTLPDKDHFSLLCGRQLPDLIRDMALRA